MKGALDDWDCNDLTVNPGGIFADVRLLLSSDVYLGRVKATPLVDVAEPRLWWPWDLGEQHLYSLDLSVREGERTLDRLSDRIGLRQVRTEPGSSAIHVNGTRVFCRPNYVSEQLQSNMTRDKYRTDVDMMREANMTWCASTAWSRCGGGRMPRLVAPAAGFDPERRGSMNGYRFHRPRHLRPRCRIAIITSS